MGQYNKFIYDYRKRIGQCTSCGKKTDSGKARCNDCLEYFRNQRKKYMEKETEEERKLRLEKNREYQRERAKRLLESGLCASCGKNERAAYSKRFCLKCLKRNNDYSYNAHK